MAEGTVLHAGLAAAYSEPKFHAGAGMSAMTTMLVKGEYDYRGETQKLCIDPGDSETIERLGDVFQYYMEHGFAASMEGATVLAVEQPFELELSPGVVYSGVIDLVLGRGNVIEAWDHKSVGDVNLALRFLGLDVQMLSYEVICAEVLPKLFPEYAHASVEMVYNLIRRERPPGFGSRSMRTKSGAKSTASTNVGDYLRTHRFAHSPAELLCIREELTRLGDDAERLLTRSDLYFARRTPIKSGGESCQNSCPYFAICSAELVGHASPTFAPSALPDSEE